MKVTNMRKAERPLLNFGHMIKIVEGWHRFQYSSAFNQDENKPFIHGKRTEPSWSLTHSPEYVVESKWRKDK